MNASLRSRVTEAQARVAERMLARAGLAREEELLQEELQRLNSAVGAQEQRMKVSLLYPCIH
jgi:hypothetical protein